MENVTRFILEKIRAKGQYDDPEKSIIALGLFDSLEFLALITEIEKKFDVDIDFSCQNPEYFMSGSGLANMVTEQIRRKEGK